jgi:hypothetical protein
MADPKPCPACPFRRTVQPGALGGSPTTKYIGQAFGPFLLPCHKHCDFTDPAWRNVDRLMETAQCAGAASFRTHIGAARYLPKAIMTLPENPDVFKSPEEFMAHHDQISIHEAERRLKERPPHVLLQEQLVQPEVQTAPLPKGEKDE